MNRQYSSEEVQQIIARALELDQHTSLQADSHKAETEGFSEGDLARIASEVGIQPEAVRQARLELQASAMQATVSGNLIRVEETVQGTLDDDGLRRLERDVSGIVAQETSGNPLGMSESTMLGSSSIRYKTGYLKEQLEGHKLQFTIQCGPDHVDLDVTDDISNSVIGLYGGIIGGAGLGIGLGVGLGIGIGVLGSAAFSVLFPVATLSGMYALSRKLVSQFRSKRIREVERLSKALITAITAETARGIDQV